MENLYLNINLFLVPGTEYQQLAAPCDSDWMDHDEPKLSLMGDEGTVRILLDRHALFTRELQIRQSTAAYLTETAQTSLLSGDSESGPLYEFGKFTALWSEVNSLAEAKQKILQDALQKATQFAENCSDLKNRFVDFEKELMQLGSGIAVEEHFSVFLTSFIPLI